MSRPTRPKPVDLLVASSGGHLKQLSRLVRRIPDLGDIVWATPDSAQGRSLLAGQDVVWLPYTAPRDLPGITRASVVLGRALHGTRVARVISTGASPALAALPLAARYRAPVCFIESAARVTGPSQTGRIMRRLPVHCFAQYRTWADEHWAFVGSVFDDFALGEPRDRPLRKAVVTVGVNETYGFGRMVKALLAALPPDLEVLWQVPATDAVHLPPGADVRPAVAAADLQAAMRDADVVISHSGAGSALTALEAGRVPLLVPRRLAFAEHVDDHQEQVADELLSRGLAVVREADQIDLDSLLTAARGTVVGAEPLPLVLPRRRERATRA